MILSIFQSPIMTLWAPLSIFYTIIRAILRRLSASNRKYKSIIDLYFDTFSLTLGVNSALRTYGSAEKIMNLFISIFAILSGIFFTGMLFQKFSVSSFKPHINSLDDLAKSGLKICVPHIDRPNAKTIK